MPQVQASRALLEHFPQPRRSAIANLFLNEVRRGAGETPEQVRVAVMMELTDRLRRAANYQWADEYTRVAEFIRILHAHEPAARQYAQWALDWESLPPEERERQKGERSAQHLSAAMDRQPPTEKQVGYLRKMGYDGPIDSKAHAAALIDIHTRGHRVVWQVA